MATRTDYEITSQQVTTINLDGARLSVAMMRIDDGTSVPFASLHPANGSPIEARASAVLSAADAAALAAIMAKLGPALVASKGGIAKQVEIVVDDVVVDAAPERVR